MGVRYHGGGAVGQDGLHEFLGAHQGTLQMDVGVQEAGQDDAPRHVRLRFAVVLSHAHDQALGHGDVVGAQLAGEHVDVGGVLQHQVRRLPARRRGDDAALLDEFPVDLSRVALSHQYHSFLQLDSYLIHLY